MPRASMFSDRTRDFSSVWQVVVGLKLPSKHALAAQTESGLAPIFGRGYELTFLRSSGRRIFPFLFSSSSKSMESATTVTIVLYCVALLESLRDDDSYMKTSPLIGSLLPGISSVGLRC